MRMTLYDLLDLYAFQNDSKDLTLMLQDYELDERIDRETFNSVIIKDLGGMVPTTNTPEVFKFMLETFFKKWKYNINKELDSMYLEYSAINNVNVTRKRGEGIKRNTESKEESEAHKTTEVETSAYDVESYQPRTKTQIDSNYSDTFNQEENATLNRDETESGHRPNQSFQELINQERELSEFNIYDWILERMRKELFLLVY